jgi:translation initiation factor IF-2
MPKKVFELAKEMELNSLDLVEKIKDMGITVRNHMSSLSDEDVDKVLSLHAAPDEKVAVKKTKKKAAKKKTTKKVAKKTTKKTTKKASAETDQVDDSEVSEEPKKKTAIRKKAVIRKKATSVKKEESVGTSEAVAETATPTDEPASAVIVNPVSEKSPDQIEASKVFSSDSGLKKINESEGKTTGLQIVSMPKKAEEQIQEDVSLETSASSDEDQKVTEESQIESKLEDVKPKAFGLRVVSMPTAEEIKRSKEEKEELANGGNSGTSYDDDKSGAANSKKRMSGLASIVSGKRPGINRSKKLSEEKSENELKSYGALSNLGTPIYTQVKRKKIYHGPSAQTKITEVKSSKRVVSVHGGVVASELAQKLSVKFDKFANTCLEINLLVKKEDYLGLGLAGEIAALYDYRVEDKAFDEDKVLERVDKKKSDLPLRNPIITIMGHVDHGKTTLLDYIRDAKVAQGEAGGITQHIGAYSVSVGEKTLTFLDTPGHAAFASMRQRGANVTDIVVLVVAADDGVMPQTKESIKFCQNAGVPIIVAVNKMDKEEAKPDRVKQELTEFELTPEDWGGDTQFCPISALKGEGVDQLLEAIALQAEIMELTASPKGNAEGVVIESRVEQGRGPVATILIQTGTLKKGDSLVVGECYGRARSLMSSLGKDLKSAGPSTPVQILGLDSAPNPGDILNVAKNEREAKKVVANRVNERKLLEAAPVKQTVSLEDFFGSAAPADGAELKTLNLIVRTDVLGSYEAIKQSLTSLSNSEVEIKVIGGGVGAINDNDVNLAAEASAYILGFNMRPMNTSRRLAENKGVDIKTYSIIYELINDIKLAMEGLLEPETSEEFTGRAEVRDTFSVPKVGVIAGSYVIDGRIEVGCNIRLLRSGKIVFDGKLFSLKRFKDDVKEVKYGLECGIGLENFNDVKVGDVFEAYKMVETKRTLEDVKAAEQKSSETINA